MIPNYQDLMRPVLKFANGQEVSIRDAVKAISENLGLSEDRKIRTPTKWKADKNCKSYSLGAFISKTGRVG